MIRSRIIPVFAISAILLVSGFGLNSVFAMPPEQHKVRFNTDETIVIDDSSSEDVLIGYHGKTKYLGESDVASLSCEGMFFDAGGNLLFDFNCSDFPIAIDPNTKFNGTVNLGTQSDLAFFMGFFGAASTEVKLTLVVSSGGESSDTVTIVQP